MAFSEYVESVADNAVAAMETLDSNAKAITDAISNYGSSRGSPWQAAIGQKRSPASAFHRSKVDIRGGRRPYGPRKLISHQKVCSTVCRCNTD